MQTLSDGRALVLVACVAGKRPTPAPARELYVSDWFIKARAWAERCSPHWAILSAEHGLVAPQQMLAPYETSLLDFSRPQRQAWGERVLAQLDAFDPARQATTCWVLAGRKYREPLLVGLQARFERVVVPMEGLGILSQKAWLKREVAQRAAPAGSKSLEAA